MRGLSAWLVAAVCLYASAVSAEPRPEPFQEITYNHFRDCSSCSGTGLRVFRNGTVSLLISGNDRSPDNPPCVGIFRGPAPAEELAALVELLRDPLFLDAPGSAVLPKAGYTTVSYQDARRSTFKRFSGFEKHSPETIAHLKKIYARLDALRASVLRAQPEISLGLVVQPSAVRHIPEEHAVEVEFALRNVGPVSVDVAGPPLIHAELSDDAGIRVSLRHLEEAGNLGELRIPPGEHGGAVTLRGDVGALSAEPITLAWESSFHLILPGSCEPNHMTYSGAQRFNLRGRSWRR